MRVLLLGQGAREHALAWSMVAGGAEVFAMPGSDGMADVAAAVAGDPTSGDEVVAACSRLRVKFCVSGPEAPLVAGVGDHVRSAGIGMFGPDRVGAELEGSKAYAKMVMREAGVPTAGASLCRDFGAVDEALGLHPERTVVKADGLATGKGVVVAEDAHAARRAARRLLSRYDSVLVEERLRGREVSLIAIAAGKEYRVLPFARDYKRLLTGNQGPNTGGMGAYCPVEDVPFDPEELAERTIAPVLKLLAERGTPFFGALFAGLMLTERGPYVLEYNVRFGDPETQALLAAIDGSILPWVEGVAAGELPDAAPRLGQAAVGVVLAAQGYPENPESGAVIQGDVSAAKDALIFHAGTRRDGDVWRVAGGRVATVVGRGETLETARKSAYAAAAGIRFAGVQMRTDVGIAPVR